MTTEDNSKKRMIAVYILASFEIIVSVLLIITNFVLGIVYLSNQNPHYPVHFATMTIFILTLVAGVGLLQTKYWGIYINIGLLGFFALFTTYLMLTIDLNFWGFAILALPLILFLAVAYLFQGHHKRVHFN